MFAQMTSYELETPAVDLEQIITKLKEINPDLDKNLKVILFFQLDIYY